MGWRKSITQNKSKKKSAGSKIKKLSLIIIGIFFLYVIAGFWVVPPLLKPRLEKKLSSQSGRKVTIEKIKLNPLVLSATTTNLTVYEKDGEPFAGFKELLIDAELSCIVRWAVTFKEIRVLSPFGVLMVLPDKTLNISDILTKFSQTEPAPEEQAELPRAVISKLQVEDGKFTVENLSGAEPVIETYSPINFSSANVSTLKEREGAFKFAGIGPLGGNYQLDGQLFGNPVRVQGSYSTTGTNLSQIWMHIKDQVSFQIKTGTIATSGNYLLELIDGTLQAKLQDGVEVKDRIQTEDFISQKQLKASGVVLDILPNRLHVADVLIHKTHASVTIDQNGTVNVVQAFTPVPKKGEKGKKHLIERLVDFLILQIKGPMPMSIDLVNLDNFAVDFVDGSIAPPYKTHLEIAKGTMKGLSSDPSARADFKIDGTIDQSATIKSAGQMNALNAMHCAKVDFLLKGCAQVGSL